jgi:hypothetical protein
LSALCELAFLTYGMHCRREPFKNKQSLSNLRAVVNSCNFSVMTDMDLPDLGAQSQLGESSANRVVTKWCDLIFARE